MKKFIATISILIDDRQKKSLDVQKVLSAYSHLIIARLGINVQRKCLSNCPGLIILSLEGDKNEIKKLADDINGIEGTISKKCFFA
jgi:metal-responsive CopG/Arc/MetJ family transcriptional regulator